MTGIRVRGRIVLTVALAVFAVGCATLAELLCSILWRGEWKYSELVAPICGAAVAGALALTGTAFMLRGRSGIGAVIRSGALLTLACVAVSACLFFSLLENCGLSCGNRVIDESRSPSGQWTAVLSMESCTATARYCPPISHVVLLNHREDLPRRQAQAFSLTDGGGLRLEWKSDNLLLISYPAWSKVLVKRDRVGSVRLEYRPIGWM